MKRLSPSKILAITLAASALFSGCTKKKDNETVIVIKEPTGEALAKVGNTVLSVEALRQDFLARQGQFKGAPNLNTDKARSDYLENQVMQEAMFLDAVEQGYATDPEIVRNFKKLVVQSLVRKKLDQAQKEFAPTDAQIEEHYNKNANLYNREEAVKVAFVAVPFGKNKNKAKEFATLVHKDALSDVKNANAKAFARLPMKYAEKVAEIGQVSVETNETDYLERAAFETKFGPEAFEAIKKIETLGQVNPVLETPNAYVVMMKTGYRKALNETLADARAKIVKRLAYESRGEFYKKYTEDLRKKYNIEIYKEKIAELSKGADEKVAKAEEAGLNKSNAQPPAAVPAAAPTGNAAPAAPVDNAAAAPAASN